MNIQPHDVLEARAKEWMRTHPEAMDLFEKLAIQASQHRSRFGMKLLAERIRWEFQFERPDGEQFKLNNSHVAFIARELIQRHPHLADNIETRASREA